MFLGMLDGSYVGWSEAEIIDHLLATTDSAPADSGHNPTRDDDRDGRPGAPGPDSRAADDGSDPTPDTTHRRDASPPPPPQRLRAESGEVTTPPRLDDHSSNLGDHAEAVDNEKQTNVPEPDPAPRHNPSLPRRAGVEIRVEITTLLGLDDHPGEIAGWGPVHADVARRLVHDQTGAEWRFAITDEAGRLLHEGITLRRPGGYPARAASPCRGGIVELQVKLSTLRHLAAGRTRFDSWAKIVADLAHQAEQLAHDSGNLHQYGRGGRSPGRPLRRRTEIRDRSCIHPGCRAPAHGTDGDHTQDWADGGATHEGNIGSACRHDHRLKHEGGWTVTQPKPGHFVWISRLGRRYHVHPPLIIPPLPDPVPRDPPLPKLQNDHPVEDRPTWPANSVLEPQHRPRAPVPPEDPPF